MGGLRSFLLAGVGPVRGPLAASGLRGLKWRLAEDPLEADLLVLAGLPGPRLTTALLELRGQLPRHIETLWVTESGSGVDPALGAALSAHAPLRITPTDRAADVATLAAAGQAFADLGGASELITAPLPRLVELDGVGDLASEDLVLSLGPLHPALATPIRLILALDGEQIRDVVRDPGYAARPIAPGAGLAARLDPDAPVAAGVTEALLHGGISDIYPLIAACERERAALLLHACARHLWLIGMVPAARELQTAADAARDGQPLPMHVPAFLHALRQRSAMRLRMRGVGVIGRSAAERARLRGPVGRASGVGDDARADGTLAAAYDRLGGIALTDAPVAGDDAARFARRLLEADRALVLAAAADRADPVAMTRQDRIELEAPRGRLIVVREKDGSFRVDPPSSALLDLLPAALIGARYADAVVTVDGFDASAEEAEQAEQKAARPSAERAA